MSSSLVMLYVVRAMLTSIQENASKALPLAPLIHCDLHYNSIPLTPNKYHVDIFRFAGLLLSPHNIVHRNVPVFRV